MAEDLREKLAADVALVSWAHLEPHQERDGIVLVAPEVGVVDAALAFALDATERVDAWVQGGQLGRPTAEAVGRWRAQGGVFRVLIVQPWVLVEEVAA